MQAITTLEHMETQEVLSLAQHEWERRKSEGRGYPTEATYELFRRALVDGDERAWHELYAQYENLIGSWISHQTIVSIEAYPSLVNEIWAKLFASVRTAEKFSQFASLASVLAYLKCCTATTCIDAQRVVARQPTQIALDDMEEEYAQAWPVEQLVEVLHFQALVDKLAPPGQRLSRASGIANLAH